MQLTLSVDERPMPAGEESLIDLLDGIDNNIRAHFY